MTWLLLARAGLGRAWDWITANTTHLLLTALAVAVLAALYFRHEAAKWERVAESTFAAQKQAARDQVAVNHAPAAKSAAIAEKSNAESPAYYDALRAAADANRVRPAACPVGAADLPGTDRPIESVHRSDDLAELVCRPAIEDRQLVDAAGRAAEMHQEALDLIALGVAKATD